MNDVSGRVGESSRGSTARSRRSRASRSCSHHARWQAGSNLVEVYYRVERDHGRAAADETLASLRAALAPDLPGTARMIEVARLKARAAIALGDGFAVATAAAHGIVLLTGDPAILRLADSPCRLEDLRR